MDKGQRVSAGRQRGQAYYAYYKYIIMQTLWVHSLQTPFELSHDVI